MANRYSFVHPSKLWPDSMPRESRPPVPIPSKYEWEVRWFFKFGMNPVLSPAIYITQSYDDAWECLKSIGWVNKKLHKICVKQRGKKRLHWDYIKQSENQNENNYLLEPMV